jgi:hypothetical protein
MHLKMVKYIVQRGDDTTQLDQMDKLAKKLGLLDRQRYLTAGSEPLVPRLCWADGISSLSDLDEAKYKVGIMLTIVVLTLQDDDLALLLPMILIYLL